MTEPGAANAQAFNTDRQISLLITVAICTRNRASSFKVAAESVIPQLTPEAELLIIDNASTDDTPKISEQFVQARPNVRVWREQRSGIPFARNAALQQARGDYVLFFDDDELAEPDWLANYIDFLRTPPTSRLGCVGGPYLPDLEHPPPSWMNSRHANFDLGGGRRALTDKATPAGGNCAYDRKIALQLGGFATDLPRCEDSELNARLRDAGYEVWWLPEARIRHRIDPERFRLGAQLRLAFSEGRAVAAFRARRSKSPAKFRLIALGRILIMPLHILIQGFSALLALLSGQRQRAFDCVLRICRNLGMAGGWFS